MLFAHTAGDVAEGELMRAEGSTLGGLRDWSPSPAWPEGRGLMLLRPLLDVQRAALRDWLKGQGADWIEDPANEDPKYARSRARAALLPLAEARDRSGEHGRMGRPGESHLGAVLPLGEGMLAIDRSVSARALAAALVCAGGGDRPPRGDRLDRLLARLKSGESFTATLCGARIVAAADQVLVTREPGEFARRPAPPLPLPPGVETVWDGRWAVAAAGPGWSVAPAAGRMAGLSKADRARLAALPPAARAARPVLFRNGAGAPVLAGPGVTMRSLVEQRLALALDRMTHETELEPCAHGATPRNHLFSGADLGE